MLGWLLRRSAESKVLLLGGLLRSTKAEVLLGGLLRRSTESEVLLSGLLRRGAEAEVERVGLRRLGLRLLGGLRGRAESEIKRIRLSGLRRGLSGSAKAEVEGIGSGGGRGLLGGLGLGRVAEEHVAVAGREHVVRVAVAAGRRGLRRADVRRLRGRGDRRGAEEPARRPEEIRRLVRAEQIRSARLLLLLLLRLRLGGLRRLGSEEAGGGGLLLLADCLARSISASEVPVSIITSLLGAPFLFYLMCRKGDLHG